MIKSLINNPEELKKLYITEGKSLKEIGDICGVAFQTVHKWMKKNNIQTRDYGTKGMKFPGRTLTQEQKDHLSQVHTGKKMSEETKKKISHTLVSKGIKSGPNNNNWKGGRWTDKYGYVWVWVNQKRGAVKEHRYVMEQHIGRILKSVEHIHHINRKRDDNRIINLEIVSNYEHALIHWTDPETIKKQSERLKKIREEKYWSSNPELNK